MKDVKLALNYGDIVEVTVQNEQVAYYLVVRDPDTDDEERKVCKLVDVATGEIVYSFNTQNTELDLNTTESALLNHLYWTSYNVIASLPVQIKVCKSTEYRLDLNLK